MRSLREEIARSRQTVDNDPVQYHEHEEVDVEMYANDSGTWSVKVSCTSDPSLSFPMQKFPDEASADHYARQCCDRIIRKKMNEIRAIIRTLILEASAYQCNKHSLGWINTEGDWLDCRGSSHGEWLMVNYYDNNPPDKYTIPENWIKVSNANNIFFCGDSFDDISPNQVDGLIEMWGECSNHSRWIQTQTETFYVTFGLIDKHEPKEELLDMFEMTIPEFLHRFGGPNAIDNFYGMLLGE